MFLRDRAELEARLRVSLIARLGDARERTDSLFALLHEEALRERAPGGRLEGLGERVDRRAGDEDVPLRRVARAGATARPCVALVAGVRRRATLAVDDAEQELRFEIRWLTWPPVEAASSDSVALEQGVYDECQALARVVVDDGEHPQAATVRDRVGEKIEALGCVGPIRHEHGLRVPSARLRPPRRRTCNFSSR